ncbi:MAG: NAD(P)H-hydrate dehydratase [Saprospiraceae bacterium]|nr:NAD(P)H-hydrate dehydratase [Saprospiraceae bacterium]
MLPIYNVEQTRHWDLYTLEKESISSLELMESAATVSTEWLLLKFGPTAKYLIFCGNGNNGGDGICIARQLAAKNLEVYVSLIPLTASASNEFLINLDRFNKVGLGPILEMEEALDLLKYRQDLMIIDSILGSGLNREPSGDVSKVIQDLNICGHQIVSIDIPSGMYANGLPDHIYVRANFTLCIQSPKLSALLPVSGAAYGQISILDIGLHPLYLSWCLPDKWYVLREDIQNLIRVRKPFDYKNKFGHVLTIGGCPGMVGAILMASKAALRTGCGLCTIVSFEENRVILQTALPEAMFYPIGQVKLDKYTVLAMGPGMGCSEEMRCLMLELLNEFDKKVVLDADALNMISHESYFESINAEIVITPHVVEFDRLFGKCQTDFERIDKAIQCSSKYNITIVLKGHYTAIVSREGIVYFNSSGNPGLAKAGSGDVLCGMIGAFLAQDYPSLDACLLAVYLHGYTADFLLNEMAMESIMASDIIDALPRSFFKLKKE